MHLGTRFQTAVVSIAGARVSFGSASRPIQLLVELGEDLCDGGFAALHLPILIKHADDEIFPLVDGLNSSDSRNKLTTI